MGEGGWVIYIQTQMYMVFVDCKIVRLVSCSCLFVLYNINFYWCSLQIHVVSMIIIVRSV